MSKLIDRASSVRLAASAPAHRSVSWHRLATRLGDVAALGILSLGALGAILPFMWLFSTSLRPVSSSYLLPPAWLPTSWHFENYARLLTEGVPLPRFAFNSFLVASLTTIGQLATCSTAGYAFAQIRFPGRQVLLVALLTSLMVPIQVTIIPLYLLLSALGLVDNPLSIVLLSLTSAFGVFLLRQFFLSLPRDLIDAAHVDGAGNWRTFWHIALPLSRPALAALGTITFVTMWNSYFLPLIILNSTDNLTLPVGILALRLPFGDNGSSVFMAAVSLSVLPTLVVFVAAQRWIIETMTRVGIKG